MNQDLGAKSWKRSMGFLMWEMWVVGSADLFSAVLWIYQIFKCQDQPACSHIPEKVRIEESDRQATKDSTGRASI